MNVSSSTLGIVSKLTIRTKLILYYCGLLTVLVLFIGGSAFFTMRWTLVNEIDRTLDETATQVLRNSRAFLISEFSGPSSVQVQLPPLDVFRASGVYVQVWDQVSTGEPQFAAASNNLVDFESPLDPTMLSVSEPTYTIVDISGTDLRVLTQPVYGLQGQLFGTIQVGASLHTVNKATDQLLVIMLIGGGGSMLLSVGVGLWLSNQALKPVKGITRAAARVATTDDLSTRLNWDGPNDELGQLVSVFNQMMGRLEHLFNVQRRFVADVSHELRTPLTGIRGNLEIIQRYGMDDDSFEAVGSEVERMSRLVNDLLLLARADYGGLTLDLGPLDLDTLITETLREAQGVVRGKERDLQVVLERFEPVRVNGNSDRLKQLLLNLISNAIKFTPDGGKIILRLYARGNYAVMEVEDTGVGIPPEEVQQIFERFYQAGERAISRGDGFGLGLSIAKWIVEAHHGKITVASELSKGTVFTINIPIYGVTLDAPPEDLMPAERRSRIQALMRRRLNANGDTVSEVKPQPDNEAQPG